MSETGTQKVAALVRAFQKVGAPLMVAVTEVRAYSEEPDAGSAAGDADVFARLVESTADVARHAARRLGAGDVPGQDWIRWEIAASAARVVAANYRATGGPMGPDDAERLAEVVAAGEVFAAGPGKPPAVAADDAAAARIHMLGALAPVIGAVARFSFGYAEHVLVGEVAARLQTTAAATARLLLSDLGTAAARPLYNAVLETAGQLYAECHFGEMDRLLDLSAEERARYAEEHGGQVPMTPVWQAFDLRMEMLAAMARHLHVPDLSQVAAPDFSADFPGEERRQKGEAAS